MFNIIGILPVYAANINRSIIELSRNINGTEFEVDEKFNINYSINPLDIPLDKNNTNIKDIVLVIDTSGSMKDTIDYSDYSKDNKSKLEIMKNTAKNFVDQFSDNENVNINVIQYNDLANIEYSDTNLFNNCLLNEYNIKNICSKLNIGLNNIYYRYHKNNKNEYFNYNLNKHFNHRCYGEIYIKDKYGNYIKITKYSDLINELDINSNYNYNKTDLVKEYIDNLYAEGGTNIGDGLRKAYYLLNDNNGHDKYIVLMTDGLPTTYTINIDGSKKFDNGIGLWKDSGNGRNDPNNEALNYAKNVADTISKSSINTFVIGFGNDATNYNTSSKNIQIAERANGKYFNAMNEYDLNNIYNDIEKYITANKQACIYFEENIPHGAKISEADINKLPKGLKVNGRKIYGYLDDIYYKNIDDKSGNIAKYTSKPFNFFITYTTVYEKNNCSFNNSFIIYSLYGQKYKKYFNTVSFDIKKHTNKKYVCVDRIIEDSENKINTPLYVTYKITPERIPINKISDNKEKDVILVIDTSGSMNFDMYGYETNYENEKRLSIIKQTASKFVEKCARERNVNIGLVQYNQKLCKCVNPSKNYNNIISAIKSMKANGGTNTGEGLRKSYYMLNNNNGHDKYIILMTDGSPTAFTAVKGSVKYTTAEKYSDEALGYIDSTDKGFLSLKDKKFETSNKFYNVSYVVNYEDGDEDGYALEYTEIIGNIITKNEKIKTFVVGFSSGIDEDTIEYIADSTNGTYIYSDDNDILNEIYNEIQKLIAANLNSNIYFYEKLYGNIKVIDELPDGLKYNSSNNRLGGNIEESIYYTLSDNGYYYEADPLEFTIKYEIKDSNKCWFGKNNSSYILYKINNKLYEKKYLKPESVQLNIYQKPLQ
jgi:Mg-chelatase subunit ChlD